MATAELKRLFMLITRLLLPEVHHLCWIWWRRRHAARARWSHHRARSADNSSRHDTIKVRLPYQITLSGLRGQAHTGGDQPY